MASSPKILVVGDCKTGKTNMCYDVMEVCGNKVWGRPTTYEATKGVEVRRVIDNLQIVKLWDFAGHPDHQGFTEIYYECADAAVVVGPPGEWAEMVRDVAGNIPVVHAGMVPDLGQIVTLWRN